MVATSILSTDDEMNAMAGENVNATGWIDANKTAWGLQAEAFLNSFTAFDFSTNVATLNATTKQMLSEYVARYTAMQGLGYNFLGTTSNTITRIETEDRINVHVFRMEKIEKLLTKQTTIDWISKAA